LSVRGVCTSRVRLQHVAQRAEFVLHVTRCDRLLLLLALLLLQVGEAKAEAAAAGQQVWNKVRQSLRC
jgi:hypothetical protein